MTRNRLWAGFFFLIVMLVVLIGGCGKNDPVVAFIGDKDQVSLSELKTEMLRGRPESQWAKFSEKEVNAYLERVIDNKLTMVAALDEGMETNETVLKNYRPRYQNFMLKELYTQEIFGKVIPDADIRAFYAHEGRKVHFSDILLKFSKRNPTEVERDSVKAIADSVYRCLKKGEDFAAMAKAISQHPTSAQNDGKVGVVIWTTAADPIRNQLWEMRKGEISKPVANYKGFHILKVDELETVEKEPFEKARGRIRGLLERERSGQLKERAETYWLDLKADRKVVFDEDKVTFWAEWFAERGNTCGPIKEALKALPQAKKDEAVVRWDSGVYTIQLVVDRISTVPDHIELRLGQEKIFREFFERAMQADFLTQRAEALGFQKKAEAQKALRQLKDNEIVRVFIEDRILDNITVTDEAVLAHYEATKATRYLDKERIKIREIMVRDQALAEKIARKAKAGQNFGRLAQQYTERPNHKKVKGEFSWFTEGRWGEIGKIAWDMKVNQVHGPLYLEKEKAYSIFKMIGRRAQGYFPFKDVEKRVKADLILHKKNMRKEAWLKLVRKKYDIRIVRSEIKKSVSKNG